MPIGSSKTPGLLTWPETQTMRVPPDLAIPMPANHSPPFMTISGRFIIVSTLLTTVGA